MARHTAAVKASESRGYVSGADQKRLAEAETEREQAEAKAWKMRQEVVRLRAQAEKAAAEVSLLDPAPSAQQDGQPSQGRGRRKSMVAGTGHGGTLIDGRRRSVVGHGVALADGRRRSMAGSGLAMADNGRRRSFVADARRRLSITQMLHSR